MTGTPFALQLVNALAALLLLVSFAMLSQRRVVSLVNLLALQGVILLAATLLLAACASQPGQDARESAPDPARSQARPDSPVLGFREDPEEARKANTSQALAKPLDATRLPPFEGQREELAAAMGSGL
mgnify:CR=1 FL=1